MKKLLLLALLATFMHFAAFAQIPNSSFENWTGNNPNDWSTPNPYTSIGGVNTCTPGSPGNPGAFYLKLISKNVPLLGQVIPGAAFSGQITVDLAAGTVTPKSGFPYTQRSQSLTGQWQYMAATPTDMGFAGVLLTKWNTTTNKRDTVAFAFRNLTGMVMSWSPFSIPLVYKKTINPDSCMIWFSSSSPVAPAANSYLYVDGLAFTGMVSGVAANSELVKDLNVYPNPAREKIILEFAAAKPEELTIQLTDAMGRIVKNIHEGSVTGHYRRELPTAGLTKGLYLLKVSSGEAVQTKRIVIE